jgi:hypothetical protein
MLSLLARQKSLLIPTARRNSIMSDISAAMPPDWRAALHEVSAELRLRKRSLRDTWDGADET